MNIDSYEHFVEELITFYEDLNDETESLNDEEKSRLLVSILRLEKQMFNIRNTFKFPDLDYSLFSKNVATSLFTVDELSYFRPFEYQYTFLLFLFLNSIELEHCELNELINLYFKKVEDQLAYPDIMKTKTGAVRCKTNVRFAILYLREIGLVNYYDKESRRCWMPSLLGFLVCSYICTQKKFNRSNRFKIEHILGNKSLIFDNKLIESIGKLSTKTTFDELLTDLKLNSLGLSSLEKAYTLVTEYNAILGDFDGTSKVGRFSTATQKDDLKQFIIKEEASLNFRTFKRDLALKANSEINFNELMKLISSYFN